MDAINRGVASVGRSAIDQVLPGMSFLMDIGGKMLHEPAPTGMDYGSLRYYVSQCLE